MPQTSKLTFLLDKLIADGTALVKTRRGTVGEIADHEGIRIWANELVLFKSLAGELVQPWSDRLQHNGKVILADYIEQPLSSLRTIKFAIEQGLLTRFEDLVIADTFADLNEQGAYLLEQGFFLAAGAIFRAVLEEKLRKLCIRHGCQPNKARPTISDYNQALYVASPPVYDKNMMLHVTSLAAVGNDAAHNDPKLKKEDVERFMKGLQDFLARYSQ
jgi:hypothetical protein